MTVDEPAAEEVYHLFAQFLTPGALGGQFFELISRPGEPSFEQLTKPAALLLSSGDGHRTTQTGAGNRGQ